jgi:zinc transport system permease protein
MHPLAISVHFGFLQYAFMRRAMVAAVLVGLTAPAIGVYLVQRRLSLMGDGIGHIALTGVGVGVLLGRSPVLFAVITSAVAGIGIELIRSRGRTSGDVALAMLFYGGIAGGVFLIGLSSGSVNLDSYLFGSLLSVSTGDLWVIAVLSVLVLAVTLGLRRELFAVCHDEEYARVTGLPVRLLNILIAVIAAVTVTVAMRVVGLLLVSALMVVPVATAQQVSRSFRATVSGGMVVGVVVALSGVVVSYQADVAPGASIVVLAIAVFVMATLLTGVGRRRRAGGGRNGDGENGHPDDLTLDGTLEPTPDLGS